MVYKSLDKSKKKVKKKKIIIGDSVGSQLFSPYEDTDSTYSLCTTGPASIVSAYIILQNFIAANNIEGMEFYYLATPHAFSCQFKSKYTYNHFVKPFYTWGNRPYFTPALNDSIQSIPYWYAAQLPFIKASDFQPSYQFTYEAYHIIPAIAIDYLNLINKLVKEKHLNFKFVMPFIDEEYRNEDNTYMLNIIKENGLEDIFADYYKNRKYLPSNEFKPDHHHYAHAEKIKTYSVGI